MVTRSVWTKEQWKKEQRRRDAQRIDPTLQRRVLLLEVEGTTRRVPCEVEGRGENGEEAENGGEEEEEVIGEGRVNRHELDEKKREAEKDEEDRFKHVQAVEGEG